MSNQFHNQFEMLKVPLLNIVLSRTQRYSVWNDIGQREAANGFISEAAIRYNSKFFVIVFRLEKKVMQ